MADGPATAPELERLVWPVLASADAEPVARVFLELVGLGAASVAPFDELSAAIVDAWVAWVVERLDHADPEQGRREALAVVARLDGLLILRHTSGPQAAEDAARHLGIVD